MRTTRRNLFPPAGLPAAKGRVRPSAWALATTTPEAGLSEAQNTIEWNDRLSRQLLTNCCTETLEGTATLASLTTRRSIGVPYTPRPRFSPATGLLFGPCPPVRRPARA